MPPSSGGILNAKGAKQIAQAVRSYQSDPPKAWALGTELKRSAAFLGNGAFGLVRIRWRGKKSCWGVGRVVEVDPDRCAEARGEGER